MKEIYIKTVKEQITNHVSVSLFLDTDGMKYQVSDTRVETEIQPKLLRIEVPATIRREILRRAIPSINGMTGTLTRTCQISQQLDNFIFECWEIILLEERFI